MQVWVRSNQLLAVVQNYIFTNINIKRMDFHEIWLIDRQKLTEQSSGRGQGCHLLLSASVKVPAPAVQRHPQTR